MEMTLQNPLTDLSKKSVEDGVFVVLKYICAGAIRISSVVVGV